MYISETAQEIYSDELPNKSKEKYEKVFYKFRKWLSTNNITNISEDVLLDYFNELSCDYKSSTLWCVYSMLKATISLKFNVDIAVYFKLIAFLKRKAANVDPLAKKYATFSSEEVKTFISKAPNKIYLATKVALIMSRMGACRPRKLKELKIQDVKDLRSVLLVHLKNTKNKTDKKFVITDHYYTICRKYMDLRPSTVDCNAFFLSYINGKCTRQAIGIHKFGAMGKQIATYLNLPHPELYTGHCFRRASVTLFADSGADSSQTALKRHAGYVADSMNNKILIAQNIGRNIEKPSTITSATVSSTISSLETTPALNITNCIGCTFNFGNTE